MNYAEKLKLLPGAERAQAWELFTKLAQCLIRPDEIHVYRHLAQQANKILQRNGLDPAFDTALPDEEFCAMLTAHFRQIKKNNRQAD